MEVPNRKDSTIDWASEQKKALLVTYKNLTTCKAGKFLIKHGNI